MRRLFAFFVVALLAATSFESASAQFTSDLEAYNECVGTPIQALDEIRTDDGQLLTETGEFSGGIDIENQVFSWGSISSNTDVGFFFGEPVLGVGNDIPGFTILEAGTVELTLDPAQGTLNGFCFGYIASSNAEIRVLFDGDAEPETFSIEPTDFNEVVVVDDTIVPDVICWNNQTGQNVTAIELTGFVTDFGAPLGEGVFNVFTDLELCFEAEVEPEDPSSYEKLGEVVTSLELFAMSLDGCDAHKAECALDLLNIVNDEVFWELPEGERLSRYGSTVFLGSAYAIHYLNKIDNEEAQLLAEDIVCVLEQVVDFEIAYAIENGGRADFIERAEDIADVAEYIDEEVDCDAIAALVYRRAWLYAFCSTY